MNWYKIIFTITVIVLASGSWFALDYLNMREQEQAREIQQGLNMARTEASRRSQTQASFTTLINAMQQQCEAAADKAQEDYLNLMQKTLPVTRKKAATLPQAILDEAANIKTAAKSACLQWATDFHKKGL